MLWNTDRPLSEVFHDQAAFADMSLLTWRFFYWLILITLWRTVWSDVIWNIAYPVCSHERVYYHKETPVEHTCLSLASVVFFSCPVVLFSCVTFCLFPWYLLILHMCESSYFIASCYIKETEDTSLHWALWHLWSIQNRLPAVWQTVAKTDEWEAVNMSLPRHTTCCVLYGLLSNFC